MSCQCLFLPRQEIRECVCFEKNTAALPWKRLLVVLCSLSTQHNETGQLLPSLPWASSPINTATVVSSPPYNLPPSSLQKKKKKGSVPRSANTYGGELSRLPGEQRGYNFGQQCVCLSTCVCVRARVRLCAGTSCMYPASHRGAITRLR